MDPYCTNNTCPLVNSCKIYKPNTHPGPGIYANYGNLLIAINSGWYCPHYILEYKPNKVSNGTS